MLPVYAALAVRFIMTWIVVGTALAVGLSLAAFADGRPPRADRLIAATGVFAPALAAIWRLLDLCRHQAPIALSALGARPVHLALFLTGLAVPIMAADRPTGTPGIHSTPTRLEAPDMRIEWRDGTAWRADLQVGFDGVPPPGNMVPIARNHTYILALRGLMLFFGLLGLLRSPAQIHLPLGAAIAVLVFWIGR